MLTRDKTLAPYGTLWQDRNLQLLMKIGLSFYGVIVQPNIWRLVQKDVPRCPMSSTSEGHVPMYTFRKGINRKLCAPRPSPQLQPSPSFIKQIKFTQDLA